MDVQLHDKGAENRDIESAPKPLTPEQKKQYEREYAANCLAYLREKTTLLGLALLIPAIIGSATGIMTPLQYTSLFAPVPALLFPQSSDGQGAFSASFSVLLAMIRRKK